MAEIGKCAICGTPLRPSVLGDRCLRCLLSLGLEEENGVEEPVQEAAGQGRRLGDYELLEELARGGMGIIHKARQVSLNRTVAVKMLLAGSFAVPEFVQRFRIEAEAAASLHHPNIVPIHEFAHHEGQHYLVMDYAEGQSLGQLIQSQPLPPRQSAAYLQTIAETVQRAHEQGILHRDLKPSNILVDLNHELRITDFGLAKRLASESDITITGQTIGSPTHSAPEQVAGKHKEVGPHSDVYSLGAVLYEMLTGRPPFVGDSVTAVIQQVQDQEVVSPRLLNSAVPRNLESICLKCLEKEWRRRYDTAEALAEDLARFLDEKPIQARPIHAWGRVQRWCRRIPVAASLAGGVILRMLLVLIGSPVAIFQINGERSLAVAHAAQEAVQRQRAERTLRELDAERIRDLFKTDRAAEGVAWLAYLLRRNPRDEPAAEWLMNELTQRSFALPAIPPLPHRDMVHFTTFSPDGNRVLTVCRDNSARLWDAATGWPLSPPLEHDRSVVQAGEFRDGRHPLHANFSPDGRLVVSASVDGTARIWDAFTGLPIGQPLAHSNYVWWACLSSDNRWLATGCRDGIVRLWDIASAMKAGPELKHDGPPNYFEFSPDGRFIVTTSDDQTARVWEVATGKPRGQPMRHRHHVRWACFSPDGQRILTASADSTARIWDVATGQPLGEPFRHSRPVRTAVFSPDGRWVMTASEDRTARISRVLSANGAAPDWLSALAEAIVGKRINDDRIGEAVASASFLELKARLADQDVSGPYGDWMHWLLADRSIRQMAPDAHLSMGAYVQQQVRAANRARLECLEDLITVLRFDPMHGAAYGQAARIIGHLSQDLTPQDHATMGWASRRAVALSPEDATAWWGRAIYLERIGNREAALEAMERAFTIGLNESYFHLDRTDLLFEAGKPTRLMRLSEERAPASGPNPKSTMTAVGWRISCANRTSERGHNCWLPDTLHPSRGRSCGTASASPNGPRTLRSDRLTSRISTTPHWVDSGVARTRTRKVEAGCGPMVCLGVRSSSIYAA